VFPDHAGAADHRRERSIELQPADSVLVGLDEHTAIVREESGEWSVIGPGLATVYRVGGTPQMLADGARAQLGAAVATTR
jgi:hypothetical protein